MKIQSLSWKTKVKSASRKPIWSNYRFYACFFFFAECLQEKGIFRISGSLKEIYDLAKKFELQKKVDLTGKNTHTVAGVLKRYLRELPESIMTTALYDKFIASATIEDKEERCAKLGAVVAMLPKTNLLIVTKLFEFFQKVAAHAEHNSMNASNLALIFSASLLAPKSQEPGLMLKDGALTKRVIEDMITSYEVVFKQANLQIAQEKEKELLQTRSKSFLMTKDGNSLIGVPPTPTNSNTSSTNTTSSVSTPSSPSGGPPSLPFGEDSFLKLERRRSAGDIMPLSSDELDQDVGLSVQELVQYLLQGDIFAVDQVRWQIF